MTLRELTDEQLENGIHDLSAKVDEIKEALKPLKVERLRRTAEKAIREAIAAFPEEERKRVLENLSIV